MRYLIDDKEATKEEVKKHLQEEYEAAKDGIYFQGKIFYNFEFLEQRAIQYMALSKEKEWKYFSLTFAQE
jgi:hypothetical protein